MRLGISLFMILIFAVMAGISVSADETDLVDKKQTDNMQIEDFRKFLTIRTFLQASAVDLTIKRYQSDKDTTHYSDQIKYQPNVPANFGLGISYDGFGLSYKFGFTISESQKQKYGSTSFDDWQIYYYGRKFGIDGFLQQYRGFRLESPESYGYKTGDPETKRSDLRVNTLGLNLYYVFSDNFSMASSFKQSERQNSSGGSFLIMISSTLYSVTADRSLIPPSVAASYGNDASFSGALFSSIGIAPGFAYTIVFRNFYFTPAIFLGTGFMNKKRAIGSGVTNNTESYIKANVRGALGYNGNGFFAGISILNDVTNSERWFGKGTGMSVQIDIINIEIFFGKRIDIEPLFK